MRLLNSVINLKHYKCINSFKGLADIFCFDDYIFSAFDTFLTY